MKIVLFINKSHKNTIKIKPSKRVLFLSNTNSFCKHKSNQYAFIISFYASLGHILEKNTH